MAVHELTPSSIGDGVAGKMALPTVMLSDWQRIGSIMNCTCMRCDGYILVVSVDRQLHPAVNGVVPVAVDYIMRCVRSTPLFLSTHAFHMMLFSPTIMGKSCLDGRGSAHGV